jgi:hypothetical protein
MAFARALITALVVTIVLDLILDRYNKEPYSKNINHFTARCGKNIIIFGCVGGGIFAFVEIGGYLAHQEIPFILTVLLGIFLVLPALFLCLAAIPGFWEMRVDNDDITITKLFFIKKHWKVSEIDHCIAVTGEMRVYVKGRKRMAFLVDAMFKNFNTFVDRMNKENIQIINKERKN